MVAGEREGSVVMGENDGSGEGSGVFGAREGREVGR